MKPTVHPRLIRPERDGEKGEWAYLFRVEEEEYIFPARVSPLKALHSRLGSGLFDDAPYKVIYWKASEWPKYHPAAVEWIRRFGFRMPNVPYPFLELRKIDDLAGDGGTVAEVLRFISFQDSCIWTEQWQSIGDDLFEWRQIKDFRLEGKRSYEPGKSLSIANACDWVSKNATYMAEPDFAERIIGPYAGSPDRFFEILTAESRLSDRSDHDLRIITIWIAFCLYINSLKTTYVDDGIQSVSRKRSAPRTLEEAVALEQAVILKSAGILKSGVRRRHVLNPGSGTKHRYRYLVRGHERVINGKSIWVKPQIRGNGEFMVLPTATTPEVQALIPETAVTVVVPAEATHEPARAPLMLPAPNPAPRPVKRPGIRSLISSAFRFLTSLLR